MKEYINMSETSKLLDCTKRTLRYMEEKGVLIPDRTMGNHRLYKMSVIIEYIEKPVHDFLDKLDIRRVDDFGNIISLENRLFNYKKKWEKQ